MGWMGFLAVSGLFWDILTQLFTVEHPLYDRSVRAKDFSRL